MTERFAKIIESVAGFLVHPIMQAIPSRAQVREPVTVFPTGFKALDRALGTEGLPQGKITELMGSGTISGVDGVVSVASKMAAYVQRKQQHVTIVDLSQNFDLWQAERCGLVAPHLLYHRPATMLDAITLVENAATEPGLTIINFGLVSDLFRDVGAGTLKTLTRRLRLMTRQAETIFLCLTLPRQEDPFHPLNYPAGFPLAQFADVRLWLQNETWKGLNYKAMATVIKNEFATPGPAAEIKIKLGM